MTDKSSLSRSKSLRRNEFLFRQDKILYWRSPVIKTSIMRKDIQRIISLVGAKGMQLYCKCNGVVSLFIDPFNNDSMWCTLSGRWSAQFQPWKHAWSDPRWPRVSTFLTSDQHWPHPECYMGNISSFPYDVIMVSGLQPVNKHLLYHIERECIDM